MKVENRGKSPPVRVNSTGAASVGKTPAADPAASAGAAAKAGPAAQVTISSSAQARAASGEMNVPKVNALSGQIADGSFKVDKEKIASAIVDEHTH